MFYVYSLSIHTLLITVYSANAISTKFFWLSGHIRWLYGRTPEGSYPHTVLRRLVNKGSACLFCEDTNTSIHLFLTWILCSSLMGKKIDSEQQVSISLSSSVLLWWCCGCCGKVWMNPTPFSQMYSQLSILLSASS